MIRYGTKTINQKMQIGENEYDITLKVIHNTETPQITMNVKSDDDLFSVEITQVDMTEAHAVLNEVANIFRTATGLPMAPLMGPLPAPAIPCAPAMTPGAPAMAPGYNASFYNR